jgi:carboxylate-amine ligase
MTVPAGTTVGVEEEYHLVTPATGDLLALPQLSKQASDGWAGPRLHAEMLTSQLEAVSDICTELDGVRAALLDARARASAAAARYGGAILATSTHPVAPLTQLDIAARPRYQGLLHRFGAVVNQLNLTGLHVHVGVPDLDSAVAIMNQARPYLPLLAALTGSSPFHEGRDTSFASYRLMQIALWPQGGLPPRFDSAQHYRDVIAELVAMGMVDEPSMVLWELRPSDRYPTLEFRIADMCTDVNDAVLYAGLVRSLVRVLAERVAAGVDDHIVDDVVLRAARWRAARYGLSGELWSPRRRAVVPAALAVADLWAELQPDLAAHDEADELRGLLDRLLMRGTSAARQRRVFEATGDLRAVIADGVALTMRGVSAHGPAAARTEQASQHP